MFAYEIQLRYVIRDKIQSEKKSEKNFFVRKKDFCDKKNCLEFCLRLTVTKVSCFGQTNAFHH